MAVAPDPGFGDKFKRTCTDNKSRPVEAEEGAAYGAAILAGVGAKAWPSVDAACDALVRVAGSMSPNSEDSLVMERAYAVYRRIYPAMKSILN